MTAQGREAILNDGKLSVKKKKKKDFKENLGYLGEATAAQEKHYPFLAACGSIFTCPNTDYAACAWDL